MHFYSLQTDYRARLVAQGHARGKYAAYRAARWYRMYSQVSSLPVHRWKEYYPVPLPGPIGFLP